MDDKLLKALADEAREQRTREPDGRWDAVAEGSIDPAEDAHLRSIARASPEGGVVADAFRPLSPAFRARMRDRVRRELGIHGEVRESGVILFFRRFARPLAVAFPLAAAATIAAILWHPTTSPHALPDYDLALLGGETTMRGSPVSHGALRLGPEAMVDVRLRPATSAAGPVVVLGFASRDGDVRALPALRVPQPPGACPSCTVRAEPDGFVRVAGRASELLGLDAGVWSLWLVVAQADDIPSERDVVAAIKAGAPPAGSAWRLVGGGPGEDSRVEIIR